MKVAIFGAGATGCFLGGVLSQVAINVTLVCRPAIKQTIEENNGIGLSDYNGLNERVMPNQLVTSVKELADEIRFDLVFVMLKCHQVKSVIEDLRQVTNAQTNIVFMQNGLGSFDEIKHGLADRKTYQGITSFNVLAQKAAVFHQGTEGGFICQTFPYASQIVDKINNKQARFFCEDDINSILYSKLLLNLNNAINALADLPLKQELEQIKYRRVLAGAMLEWLAVVKHHKTELKQFTKIKPQYLPWVLKLPDWLFKRLAKQMLTIDPKARSSMWQDIKDGKTTEIDYLNGAVVRLGQTCGVKTPINQAIVDAIKQLELGHPVNFDLAN